MRVRIDVDGEDFGDVTVTREALRPPLGTPQSERLDNLQILIAEAVHQVLDAYRIDHTET